ncbi:MAG: sigma-70 family RNA polymerase sigma factor [Mycobacteriaceae bacterium]
MSGTTGAGAAAGLALLALYDDALPHVYGYLLARCGGRVLAEDLTSETFLAAVEAARRSEAAGNTEGSLTLPWLIGIARHKLADHWRREARVRKQHTALAIDLAEEPTDDPWDSTLDRVLAHATLAELNPVHHEVLSLHYVDDLTVAQCATAMGRTVHATEALLVRARRAFRSAYPTTVRAGDRRG